MIVQDFVGLLDRLAPFDLALDWDNSGLQVGDPRAPVAKAALALDPTAANVEAALAAGCQLLATHHPLIFRPLKRLDASDPQAAAVFRAVSGGLAVVAAHTNWDAVGVAQALADALELEERRPLEDRAQGWAKLVVFAPEDAAEAVLRAALEAGAGTMGGYEGCFFRLTGQGGFRAPADGQPHVGRPGEASVVDEVRLETRLPRALKGRVERAVRAAHPYEEPAVEFFDLETAEHGFGLVGRWRPPRRPEAAEAFLAERLGPDGLWAGPPPGEISIVALMPGSGGSYGPAALKAGAQLLITGDVGHHQALWAAEAGLPILSAGHFETERPGLERLAEALTGLLAAEAAGSGPELIVLPERPPFRRFRQALSLKLEPT
ncbi:MAG: Nif3-like dinuclear metal center hexameric protein [Deltaproteobacteria bacterium]|jgi:dinuclear metal center YbgI/SA1388 family protein|nr:Nif3-like dinuclear metal center hexameric protein [Deltaproteobacteria bacterium]